MQFSLNTDMTIKIILFLSRLIAMYFTKQSTEINLQLQVGRGTEAELKVTNA